MEKLSRDNNFLKADYDGGSYYLSTRWVLRSDPCFHIPYSLFDVNSGSKFEIANLTYIVLKIIEETQLNLDEAYVCLISKGIPLKKQEFLGIIEELINLGILCRVQEKSNLPQPSRSYQHFSSSEYEVPVASTPYELEIHLTSRCNLGCLHCYADAGSRRYDELEVEEWLRLFDELECLRVQKI